MPEEPERQQAGVRNVGGAMLLQLPSVEPGEMTPPMPVEIASGTMGPDVKGRVYVVLQFADGTGTSLWRMPWQAAPEFGRLVVQKLAEAYEQARMKAGPQLWTPGQMPPGVPPPGSVNGRRLG